MQIRPAGFVHLPQVVPRELVDSAIAAIDADLAANYDPARQVEYDERSACPDLRGSRVIDAVLEPARPMLDAMLGAERLTDLDGGQIAIRWAHNHPEPVAPTWHIDGVRTPHNGVEGPELDSYACLVGVFLTQTPGPFAGNFTVWPGSWRPLSAWYRQGGPERLRQGMPDIDPGESLQLQTRAGDVVILNYLMAHAAAVNTSAVQRRAIFFRVGTTDLAEHRYRRVCEPWNGWR